jgi:hypothetical protein
VGLSHCRHEGLVTVWDEACLRRGCNADQSRQGHYSISKTIPQCEPPASLTLIEPGSGKSDKYKGLFCFDLTFIQCKFTSPGICQLCNKAQQFQRSAQNSAATSVNLERARERSRLRTCHPLHSVRPRTRKLTGMLSDATPDCRPHPGRTSPHAWGICNRSKTY